jgi:hypothetical protein
MAAQTLAPEERTRADGVKQTYHVGHGERLTVSTSPPPPSPYENELPTDIAPYPQANRPEIILAVVDLIGSDEAVTDAELAHLMGGKDYDVRQGAYYASAAHRLGLVEPLTGTSPRQWALSPSGMTHCAMTDSQRTADLMERMFADPLVQTHIENGGNEGVEEYMLSEGRVNGETAKRRAQTIEAWASFIEDEGSEDAVTAARQELDSTRGERFAEIQANREARSAAEALRTRRHLPPCPVCFMQIPTGHSSCPDCC